MNSRLIVKHREMTEEEVYAQVCEGWGVGGGEGCVVICRT